MSGDLSGSMKDLNISRLFVKKSCLLHRKIPLWIEQTFHGQLFREIKKKLWFGRREDPEISIDLNVDQDVLMEGLGSVFPGIIQRGKMVYQVKSNRMFDPFLGMKWDERILNPAGDFAYVISGTIKYWPGQRNPITEYKIIGEQYIK